MAYITKPKLNIRQSKRRGTPKMIPGLIVGIVLILIFFFFRAGLSKLSLNIFSPVLRGYNDLVANLSNSFRIFEPKSNLIAENEALKRENESLKARTLGYDTLVSENQSLQEIFSLVSPQLIPVLPISFPPQTPYDTLVLNQGNKAGIEVENKVYLGDRIAVGEITNVTAGNSQVRLFSSGGVRTESVLERNGNVVSLEGQGGGSFKLELPQNFDVLEGDLIILPGSPRTIVAQIISVIQDETNPFLQVYAQLPLKISGLSALYVEIK